MATIQALLEQARNDLDAARRRRKTAHEAIQALVDGAQRANRANLTADEDRTFTRLVADRDAAKDAIARAEAKLEELQRVAVEEDQATRLASQSTPTPGADRAPKYDQVIRVGMEERTYRPDRDPAGRQFILDVVRSRFDGNTDASARLTRHMAEERVERGQYLERAAGDATSGAFAGLVVPQYLTDMYAPATAALRPLVDIANKHPLPPDGLTVNISRITTATSVALQATELTAVSATSIDDTLLTENVQTAAGQQTLSRQALERGTLTEDVVLQDLFNRYATQVDSTLINQAATGLSVNTALNTYTDGAPSVAALWPFFFKAASLGEQAFLAMAPISHVVMHTRRWNWAQSQVGSTWPFMGVGGIPPQQGALIVPGEYGTGAVRGVLSNGLRVVVDNNVPTTTGGTQDEIYVVAASEIHVWEDPRAPVFIRADQAAAATLGVLLVLYGYFAYSVRRYGATAHQRIVGTGTAAPAGF